eukprot:gene30024-17918_t
MGAEQHSRMQRVRKGYGYDQSKFVMWLCRVSAASVGLVSRPRQLVSRAPPIPAQGRDGPATSGGKAKPSRQSGADKPSQAKPSRGGKAKPSRQAGAEKPSQAKPRRSGNAKPSQAKQARHRAESRTVSAFPSSNKSRAFIALVSGNVAVGWN